MITQEIKKQILDSLAVSRKNFDGSDAKFAISLGINNAQYSRIKNGDTDKVLSDQVWISLARRQGISLTNGKVWKVANTPVFEFVKTQLELCQRDGLSSMLCEMSDVGKSETAKWYAANNKNAVYADCSQVKSKQRLIRSIAKMFGVSHTGRYADVYDDLVFYVKTLINPIIILDEFGDIQYDAFLEIKALWNALDTVCGFYIIGADGLEAKFRSGIEHKKVGYTEMFSRFGKKYGTVLPKEPQQLKQILDATAVMIIKANSETGTDVNVVLRQTLGDDGRPSLRRIRTKLSVGA